MSHHKRGKPKNSRAGCLLCKPHKMNGWKEGNNLSHSNQSLEFIAKKEIKNLDISTQPINDDLK